MTETREQHIQTSILDRLIDLQPEVSRESAQERMPSFHQIKATVVRDLEQLLNTKSQILPVPAAYKELNDSLFLYGLPDFTAQNPKSPSVKGQLRQELERVISKFEPRLKNVSVQIEAQAEEAQSLRLKISALLVLDPISEPVTFDTYFDINKGEYAVRR